MLITFKSKASGDVIMFGDVAKRLMKVMGKSPEDQGIVTVEQLSDALARLKATVAEDKANQAPTEKDEQPKIEKTPEGGQRDYVSLARRAVPLIELLEYSLKAKVPVVWGV